MKNKCHLCKYLYAEPYAQLDEVLYNFWCSKNGDIYSINCKLFEIRKGVVYEKSIKKK